MINFNVPRYFFPLMHRLIPESPRWLIAHDRLDEAQVVLETYGGKKDKPVDSQMLRSLIEDVRREQLAREREAKKYTPIDMFRTPKLRKWTVILCYQWYVLQCTSPFHFHAPSYLTILGQSVLLLK